MADIFSRWYAAVNVEWPQFGLSAEEAQMQERRWRQALGDFDGDTLAYALTEGIRTFKKRPKPSELVDLCVAHARGKSGRKPHVEPHWTLCPCGCGGRRWLLVLRDPVTGAARVNPPLEELLGVLPPHLRANSTVRAALEREAGAPMTRVRMQCLRRGGEPLPLSAYQIGEENGVPVFDVPRVTGPVPVEA